LLAVEVEMQKLRKRMHNPACINSHLFSSRRHSGFPESP